MSNGNGHAANPYALAEQLARPVARGYLTLTEAHACLLATALRGHREGSPYDPADVYRGLQHILDLHIEKQQLRRSTAEGRITRRLKPLIAVRKPSNTLLAEAHDVNGSEGFPLAEDEVNDIAIGEMYWALPYQGGRRHGH